MPLFSRRHYSHFYFRRFEDYYAEFQPAVLIRYVVSHYAYAEATATFRIVFSHTIFATAESFVYVTLR